MQEVARRLLGDPNRQLSNQVQFRYGTNGSLAVDLRKGTFYDHEACEGGGVLELIRREKGLNAGEARAWLREAGILGADTRLREEKFVEATYDYTDEEGRLVFQTVRYGYRNRDGHRVLAADGRRKKTFAQRQPAGSGWAWNLNSIEPVPYRLPQLRAAIANDQTIFIPEGEKCVDRLIDAGLCATCNAMGANKWRNELTSYFSGAKVVILSDNDRAGREHGRLVAEKLKGTADSLLILDIPGLPEKGDVFDWLEAGHTAEELQELVASDSRSPEDLNRAIEDDGRPPAFTDEALALQFAEKHADDLRYVAAWGKWLSWTGTHWQLDDTLKAFDRARRICRAASAACNRPKIAAAIASAKTVAAVERLAKADRRLAATVDQWDADPWLLNTPGGGVDLRTGNMVPLQPCQYFTKVTAVTPGGICPLFMKFLATITDNDQALQAYLQRVLGYSLTGLTNEHSLFFGYGTGANGKGVLLNTVSRLIGSYHKTAPIETFTAWNSDRHPTDLAGLRGARLVTATETEEGRRWAESRIKTLTGGDTISARFMRQDFFEYAPAFKLFITGNHKPGLRSVDEAIRRRFHLIPFAVTIPPEDRDPDLSEKLKAEWPGILAWMIEGCLQWQELGLRPSQAVMDATAAYLESEDAISTWIEEKCERDTKAWTGSTALFTSWKEWAVAAGEQPGTMKRFAQQLEARGFPPRRKSKARGIEGIRLRCE
jgi:putative DNA primase/helicase